MQYLNEEQLASICPKVQLKTLELISEDSYSDKDIWDSIIKTESVEVLAGCAIQTAIIGFVKGSLGNFKLKNELISVNDIYKACSVNMECEQGSKLSSYELTPRRICRAFRLIIRQFLEKHENCSSYLWRKYTVQNEVFRSTCYPGSEYIVKTQETAAYLLDAYSELDKQRNTLLSDRIKRVLTARGLIKLKIVRSDQ